AQLHGAIEIVVEDGSQAPKTNLGVRASIEQARQLGLLNPGDPEQQSAIFREFGLMFLIPSIDAQIKGALNEQDAFEEWAAAATQDQATMQALEQAAAMYDQQLMQFQQLQQTAGMMSARTGIALPAMAPPVAPAMTPLQVKAYHVPQVHLSEHMRWALTDRVQTLFEQAPVLERYVIWHIEATQQQIAATMAPPPDQANPNGGPM